MDIIFECRTSLPDDAPPMPHFILRYAVIGQDTGIALNIIEAEEASRWGRDARAG